MNERIKELAEQANIKYSIRDDVFYSSSFDGIYGPDMELFVELIVQECINCCDEVDSINKAFIQCYDFDPLNGPKECIQQILEHFGVKE